MLHAFGDVRLTRPVDVEDRVEARAVPVEEDGGGVAGEDVVAVAEGVLKGGGSGNMPNKPKKTRYFLK